MPRALTVILDLEPIWAKTGLFLGHRYSELPDWSLHFLGVWKDAEYEKTIDAIEINQAFYDRNGNWEVNLCLKT